MSATSFYLSAAQPFSSGNSSTRILDRVGKTRLRPSSCRISNTGNQSEGPPRRSASYHPTIWDHRTIQSIESPYSLTGEALVDGRRQQLKLEVKLLLVGSKNTLEQIQLIDSIQRLGIGYHFEDEIHDILGRIHDTHGDLEVFSSLYETALAFRLLRQQGYRVSSDVFHRYRDEKDGFMDSLTHDVKGLLSLYEASYFAFPGEEVLNEANEFSVKHLKNLSQKVGLDLRNQVRHSLESPLHRRMKRLEVRHYIDVYQREIGKSSILLEFAKMDFNFLQIVHQVELKELSKWWKNLNLGKKLKFSRDRLVENFLWAVGIVSEPQWSKCRIGLTKMICILTVVDDAYDIHGFLDEVKLFTNTVKSWDPKEMESLPKDFKLCYGVLCNFVEEISAGILVDHGCDVKPFFQKEWENLCEAYLVEAEWFHEGYIPSLEEYLKTAWISVGGPIAMVHAYWLLGSTMTHNSVDLLQRSFNITYWSSLITRLNNDLGTSKAEMERGDAAKSIQCHMRGTHEQEETSREYIRKLVDHSWKELNQECIENNLPKIFVNMVTGMARASHCIFKHGDGIGDSSGSTKNWILALIVNNVPFNENHHGSGS